MFKNSVFGVLKKQLNPKKIAIETVVGIPFAAAIGFLVMMEKSAVAKALAHYLSDDEPEKTEA